MNASSTATLAAFPQEISPRVPSLSSRERLTAAELERNRLIEDYLPLVGTVLAKVQRSLPAHINADDLYSAGVTGLIAAAERFDPAQASTFAGYVCLRIRCAMLDELRRLDSCTRRSRARNNEIRDAVLELEQALGRAPSDQEVSARLKIPVVELVRRRDAAQPVRIISLDGDPAGDRTEHSPLHEAIADDSQPCVRETMEKQELIELLANRLTGLPDMQKKILAMYYFEGMRFSEIAEAFDLTQSRISQIHKEALAKLRASIRKERAA